MFFKRLGNTEGKSPRNFNIGEIVGICVGGVAALIVVTYGLYKCCSTCICCICCLLVVD